MNHLQVLIQTAKNDLKRTVVIANAADEEILQTVKLGLAHKLCSFILLGNQNDIEEIAEMMVGKKIVPVMNKYEDLSNNPVSLEVVNLDIYKL